MHNYDWSYTEIFPTYVSFTLTNQANLVNIWANSFVQSSLYYHPRFLVPQESGQIWFH